MSFPLIVDGSSYQYPSQGDKANTGWGTQTGGWASAVTSALTKLGLGGTISPLANTVIDISSTSKGILIPRMTTVQRNAITSVPNSLLIFNTTDKVLQYYDSSVSSWISVGARLPDNAIFSGTLTVNGNIIGLGSLTLSGGIQATTIQGTIGTFSSKILTADGLVSAPAISLSSESTSGLYKIATNKLGIAINGSRVGEVGVGYGGFTGNIIQVLQASTDAQLTSSGTNSWNEITGLSVSITPKYSTSKILIRFKLNGSNTATSNLNAYQIVRGSTAVGNGAVGSRRFCHSAVRGSIGDANSSFVVSGEFLDSPGTTSATTYKMQFLVDGGTGYINRDDTNGNSTSYPSPLSVITVMEIQQ
jgi:hypothetical protein